MDSLCKFRVLLASICNAMSAHVQYEILIGLVQTWLYTNEETDQTEEEEPMTIQFVVQQGETEVPFEIGTEPVGGDNDSIANYDSSDDDETAISEVRRTPIRVRCRRRGCCCCCRLLAHGSLVCIYLASYLYISLSHAHIFTQGIRARVFQTQWMPLIDAEEWTELESVMEECPRALYSYCALSLFEIAVPQCLDAVPEDLLERVLRKILPMMGLHNILARCVLHMDHIECSRVLLQLLLRLVPRRDICQSLHWVESSFLLHQDCESILDSPWVRVLIQERRVCYQEWTDWTPAQHRQCFDAMIQKNCVWLSTAYENDDQCPALELHRLAGAPCANVVVHVALCAYPEQLQRLDPVSGQLPLHHALRHLSHHALAVKEEDPVFHASAFNVAPAAQQLVQAYPGAARIPDQRGRLPLNLAIASYAVWEEQYHLRYYHASEQPPVTRGAVGYIPHILETMRALIRAAPDALHTRDAQTGLYPFLLAATTNTSIDVIYTLLSECPTMVQLALRV